LQFKAKAFKLRNSLQEKWFSRHRVALDKELTFSQATRCYHGINDLYLYMLHYFHHRCPQIIQDHRRYFKIDNRGFGEDAFHAVWWLILSEFRPKQILEIGVYRGQTLSLWGLINKYIKNEAEVHGISPFCPAGDSVSDYISACDYQRDVEEAFKLWDLRAPLLIKSFSNEPKAADHVSSHVWDLVYIDGSHDFEIVLQDYRLCLGNLRPNGLLVMDDASLYRGFRPFSFSFAGHPGPSKVATEYADKEMKFICAVGHLNVFKKI
jgi:hypothetical protein